MTISVLEDLGQDLAMMARLVQSQLMNATTSFFQRDIALARGVMDKDDQVDNFSASSRIFVDTPRLSSRCRCSR